jgi:hypothetical protein
MPGRVVMIMVPSLIVPMQLLHGSLGRSLDRSLGRSLLRPICPLRRIPCHCLSVDISVLAITGGWFAALTPIYLAPVDYG